MTALAHVLQQAWLKRGALAWALRPISWLMLTVVTLRRQAYRHGLLSRHRLPVPVLVVGNRIAGGAGKTPATLAILAHLKAHGWHPGVLSRGYGAAQRPRPESPLLVRADGKPPDACQTGDEPVLIWRRQRVPMAIASDRVAGGRALLQQHPDIDILVCDDGLQHLRLQRDIEVIVFDERGAGNGWLLPAGPLREPINLRPLPGLVAAPVVLYNAPRASTDLPGHASTSALGLPVALSSWHDHKHSHNHDHKHGADLAHITPPVPSATRPDQCWAMAGVAHPERFFRALRQQGWAFTPLPLADHASLQGPLAWPAAVRDLLITEKDAVKLDPARCARERPNTRIWVIGLDFQPVPDFWHELDAALALIKARPSA
ncbi:tetraacyldisaccharide 4'-kinase [Aquabacterium sp. A3]|uniref:tetraacyldisaccharide 4'-kinase n=1 Tax=Aquabacterium sp. A3 TaxID=3132829 RepID=UPI00311A59A8